MLTKKYAIAFIAVFQCTVLYWIYSTHEAENSLYQSKVTAKLVAPVEQKLRRSGTINIGSHAKPDCTQMGDMDLKVIYTLWGNINMPVHTITCSAPKSTTSKYFSISNVFFTRHKDERPMVKFAGAKPEHYYMLILSESNVDLTKIQDNKQELLRWVVLNLDGKDLETGIENWSVHGSEILEYTAPKVKENHLETVYQVTILHQKEFIKTFNSEILINEKKFNCDEFIENNNLISEAHVAFAVVQDILKNQLNNN